jgi:hypothetical protein
VLTPIAWAADHNGSRQPHGYLKVYSTRDEDNNGAYYSYSSYEIYASNGRLFKRVEHNISRTDEIIPWELSLPAGSYIIVGHSATDGEVRVHFVIETGKRTIVELDLIEQEIYKLRSSVHDRVASSSE